MPMTFVEKAYQRAMYNKAMDLLLEVERQKGIEKMKEVAAKLAEMNLISAQTAGLLQNDIVENYI